MGTFTSQILFGQKHPYESGIINISHHLYLSENSRPAWILTEADQFGEKEERQPNVTWIPTLENMLEDALVMIGLYILKNEELIYLANQFFKDPKSHFIELYDDIEPKQLENLYSIARKIQSGHKIMVSVFQGSSVFHHLPVLKQYQHDIEVCVSVYQKEFSVWNKRYEESGELKVLKRFS